MSLIWMFCVSIPCILLIYVVGLLFHVQIRQFKNQYNIFFHYFIKSYHINNIDFTFCNNNIYRVFYGIFFLHSRDGHNSFVHDMWTFSNNVKSQWNSFQLVTGRFQFWITRNINLKGVSNQLRTNYNN